MPPKAKSIMNKKLLIITLSVCCIALTVNGRTVNVRSFGAKSDGQVCTEALNKTIKAAKDGDTVLIPEGRYVTGTVHLKSHITLIIEKGAEILGTENLKAYDHYKPGKPMTRYDTGKGTVNANIANDEEWTKALLLGERIEDVRICGEGTINGRHIENKAGEEGMRGPHAMLFAESQNIHIEGINVTCAGNYAIMGYELSNVVFESVRITEGWDGIHIRGGRNITIKECDIMTGDDAIAGGYWENMRITGCRLNSACNGIRMIEPSRDLFIEDCHIYGPGKYAHRTSREEKRTASIYGIVLEPGAWGDAPGHTENIHITNVTIDNVLSPLVYSMGSDNTCSGLYIDGLHATHIKHNTLPLNWQGGSGMWNDINIKDLTIKD